MADTGAKGDFMSIYEESFHGYTVRGDIVGLPVDGCGMTTISRFTRKKSFCLKKRSRTYCCHKH